MKNNFQQGFPNNPNYRLGAIRCPPDARPETAESSYFEFYPNPANESVTLRYQTKQDFQVILTDITGRKVAEKELTPFGEYTFDVSELPAGVYLVRAFSDSGTLFSEKLVIVK